MERQRGDPGPQHLRHGRGAAGRKRITYANLHAGDIVFWSDNPNGVNTASSTVSHTGIYLGKGWTINSHGCGDGVTLDYMGPGAGWYHDAFVFGWRVMPAGR